MDQCRPHFKLSTLHKGRANAWRQIRFDLVNCSHGLGYRFCSPLLERTTYFYRISLAMHLPLEIDSFHLQEMDVDSDEDQEHKLACILRKSERERWLSSNVEIRILRSVEGEF